MSLLLRGDQLLYQANTFKHNEADNQAYKLVSCAPARRNT